MEVKSTTSGRRRRICILHSLSAVGILDIGDVDLDPKGGRGRACRAPAWSPERPGCRNATANASRQPAEGTCSRLSGPKSLMRRERKAGIFPTVSFLAVLDISLDLLASIASLSLPLPT